MSQQAPPETSSDPTAELPAPPVVPRASLARRWWRSRPLAVQLATALVIVLGAVPVLLYIANAGWERRRLEIDRDAGELRRAELVATRQRKGVRYKKQLSAVFHVPYC